MGRERLLAYMAREFSDMLSTLRYHYGEAEDAANNA